VALLLARLLGVAALGLGLLFAAGIGYDAWTTRADVGPFVLNTAPLRLPAGHTVALRPARPLDARSDASADLCLGLLAADAERVEWSLRGNARGTLAVHAVLVRDDGRREQRAFSGGLSPFGGRLTPGLGYLCSSEYLYPSDSARSYVAIEVTARAPLLVQEVRWWSGKHRLFGL